MINTRSRRLRTIAIAGVALASVGTAVAAADTSTTPVNATTPPKVSPPNPVADDAKLAKALGISADKLKAARAAVQADQLTEAVKSGKLTAEQQSLIEKLRSTGLDFPLPPSAAPTPGAGQDPDTALAKELGISVSKLREARPAPPAGGPPLPGGKTPPAPSGTTPPLPGASTPPTTPATKTR